MTVDNWYCEAYGPEGIEVGAICFVGDAKGQKCASTDICREAMAQERQRVFMRINELAAEGSPTGVYLADVFTNPDQLLGGAQSDEDEKED